MGKKRKIIITAAAVFAMLLLLAGCEGYVSNIETHNGVTPCVHEYEEFTVKEPTCTEEGQLEYKCKKCGDTYNEPIPALGHDMKLIEAVQSVCIEESKRVYECSRCGLTETETQPPAFSSHDYVATITEEPSCTKAGLIEYVCSRCGLGYSESLSKLSHNFVQKSNNVSVCKDCGQECSYPADLGFEGVVKLYDDMRSALFEVATEDDLKKVNTDVGKMWVEYSTYTDSNKDSEKGLMIFVRVEYMDPEVPTMIARERIFPFQLTLSGGEWKFMTPELLELRESPKPEQPAEQGAEGGNTAGNSASNTAGNTAGNNASNTAN